MNQLFFFSQSINQNSLKDNVIEFFKTRTEIQQHTGLQKCRLSSCRFCSAGSPLNKRKECNRLIYFIREVFTFKSEGFQQRRQVKNECSNVYESRRCSCLSFLFFSTCRHTSPGTNKNNNFPFLVFFASWRV